MLRSGFNLLLAASLLCAQSLFCQGPPNTDDPVYLRGIDLLARISTHADDVAADRLVYEKFGPADAEKSLLAVAIHGQSPTATTADWKATHRAFDALIELTTEEQQLFKASIYANLQDQAYAHLEADYVSATATARRALDLQIRSGMGDAVPIPWVNLGNDLLHLGQIDESLEQFRYAERTIQDTTSSLAADIHGKIVTAELARGNTTAAQNELASFIAKATPSAPPNFRGSALVAEAKVDASTFHYDLAVTHIHQALAAVKGASDALSVGYEAVDELLSIGLEAVQNMPYDQAMTLSHQMDAGFPDLPISVSGFAEQIANHRRRLAGQFDIVLRDDAATLQKARGANDVQSEVSALLATSLDYAYLRDVKQQLAALHEAADLLHADAHSSLSPELRYRVLNALGASALTHGDIGEARSAYLETINGIAAMQSASARAGLANLHGDAQLGIASVMEKEGNLEGAREILRKALDSPATSSGLYTHSAVLMQSAHLEQDAGATLDIVAPIYNKAIEELHRQRDPNAESYARLQFVQYLADRAKAGSQQSQIVAIAREQLQLARTAAESITLAEAAWRVHFLEGLLDENTGDITGAIKSYAAAVDALNHIRTGLSEGEQRESFIDSATVQELYRHQIQLLTVRNNSEDAWKAVESDKARTFLESLNGRHFNASSHSPTSISLSRPALNAARPSPPPDQSLIKLEQQILDARLELSTPDGAVQRSSGSTPELLRAHLTQLEEQFALVRSQQSLSTSRATQPLSLVPITLAATQLKLPAHTALIEYAILDKELAAFVVTHTSAKQLHWPADTDKLPRQMSTLAASLASLRTPEDNLDKQLRAASTMLLGPVLPALPDDIDTLIIIPTQSLSLIPFQALPLPSPEASNRGFSSDPSTDTSALSDLAPQTLLVDRFTVTYLPSASTLQFLHFGTTSASQDVYLGAIGYIAVEGLPPLPGTLTETAVIQKLYPRATRDTGAAFTHDAAIHALEQHDEVHFATHGLFNPTAPLFSALITAPVVGSPDRLSLYELTNLNLKARLVILSACETDRGENNSGDEIEGLTRTFLQAGAESVISSLWSVSDESTALLMESLHAHLRAGETAPLALRHAELQVKRKFPQPYYWAAFLDTGIR